MEIPLLRDLIVIFGLSIAVLLICHRLRIPVIVGFLVTGTLCGPHGLGLVAHISGVKVLAEVGVILLLFTVGMEFSIRRILEYKRFFLLGGMLQVAMTTGVGVAVGWLLLRSIGESIYLGFLLSLSSTAIVLRILMQRNETNTPHGRLNLGILIFQDLIVVPMILLIPLLAGEAGEMDLTFLYLLGQGLLILAFVFFAAIRVVPALLNIVTRTRSRELFLLTVLLICFSVAWIVSQFGISLALGAFLAGLIISESEYKNRAIGDIIPFQEILTSLFFVSIGMLLDVGFVFTHPLLILMITVGIVFMKASFILLVGMLLGLPLRTCVLSALALAQVGEFSFILSKTGMALGLGSDFHNQLFLAVAVITMALTPSLIKLSYPFSLFLSRLPLPEKIINGIHPITIEEEPVHEDHVIIIGFGVSGKNLAESCKKANIPYVIIDMNPEKVRVKRREGEPIHYGDATHERVLKQMGIDQAKVIAVLVNDPIAAYHIVEHARLMNSEAYIIARTRYMEEMQPMYDLGADDVVPDEFGASVEVFTRVLNRYDIEQKEIDRLVVALRAEGIDIPRLHLTRSEILSELQESLRDIEARTYYLTEESPFANKRVVDTKLGKDHGITILLIRRGDQTNFRVTADTALEAGDTLVVIGPRENLEKTERLFTSSKD